MNDDRILYTDKQIQVTTKEFIVNSATYMIRSINGARMHFVRHFKYPPLTLILIGIAGIILGCAGAFTNYTLEELYIGDLLITANRLSVIIGSLVFILGFVWLSILHNEYVLVITTKDGQSNPVSSKRKDYIHQILTALTAAIKGNSQDNNTVHNT